MPFNLNHAILKFRTKSKLFILHTTQSWFYKRQVCTDLYLFCKLILRLQKFSLDENNWVNKNCLE